MKKTLKKLFPVVNVMSVEEYFALPLNKRQKWGIYLKPYALPMDFIDENEKGWNYFDKEIRKLYPIQGFFREWFLSIDNPIYRWCLHFKWKYRDIKYAIKHFIRPACPRWRASYPRHAYNDIYTVIRTSNFGLIRDFWYDEVIDGIVDWEGSPEHKEFYDWLTSAIKWIETDRDLEIKKIDDMYDKVDHSKTYEENYGEINKLEKDKDNKDTEILTQMIKYRGFFWT